MNELIQFSNMQSYERRGKVVKEGKEALLWAEVSPDLISEEEKEGDVYVRHPPSHRSDSLNKFIKKLDQRLDSKMDRKTHPRLGRRLGSPRDKTVPPGCKKWMIKTSRESTNAGQEGKDIENCFMHFEHPNTALKFAKPHTFLVAGRSRDTMARTALRVE